MNKLPLSKERRAEIEHELEYAIFSDVDVIIELLAAEAFWREAIASTGPDTECEGRSNGCHFCESGPDPHDPGCPWMLAANNS